MGIFGALTTAVTGMRAQSYALENISGNIANSQTTAYKRVDTTFQDMIADPDGLPSKQISGSVAASSRSTNTIQGDIQAVSIGTFMAVTGQGFFVVQKPSGFSDNQPTFDGIELYTRRGDFQPNKDGYLVNGAGYYLMGIPVDPTTGNLVGSVPQLLQFDNGFLPAQATTQLEYKTNLASYPHTPQHDVNVPRSELLTAADFIANPLAIPPQAARIIGYGADLNPDAQALGTGTVAGLVGGTVLTTIPGLVIGDTIVVSDGVANHTHVVAGGQTVTDLLNTLNTAGAPAVTASLDGSGRIQIVSTNYLDTITVSGLGGGAADVGFAPGNTTFQPTNLLMQGVSQGQTLIVTIGASVNTITFGNAGMPAQVATLADLQVKLAALAGGAGSSVDVDGNVTIIAASIADNITLSGTLSVGNGPKIFGIQTLSAMPSSQTVIANDVTTFLNQSIGGGAVTAYDVSGAPVNIQLRWAKIDSSAYGGTDTWNLFYQVNSAATGTQVAWRNAGVNYTFSPNGQMAPPVTNLTLTGVTVNGISLGDLSVIHGSGGITQYADPNGNAQVNLLQQNGYAAGNLQSVAVNEKGRVVGTYSNSRSVDLAEITLGTFNGANSLKRIDGGAFSATSESGPPTYGGPGRITGSSLEGSNTDIADEFAKMIITQQAYSANTRVISTGNQMIQDLLNMLR